jgi:hypothetical protein
MPGTRDHDPYVIEDFAGWWQRGDPESAPSDHFIQADNVQYVHSGCETRDGLNKYLNIIPPLAFGVRRVYNYVTQKGQSVIMMIDGGKIYHIADPNAALPSPILTIPAMEDFGFVAINGRAYITPFKTYTNPTGERYQLGIQNEFLYVYNGDQTPARKAAGDGPPKTPAVTVTQAGTPATTDDGPHLFAVVYETDTGYLTAPGAYSPIFSMDGSHQITISGIPVSPNAYVKKRHIVATKMIPSYNGDPQGYQFFFIPGATLNDNTTTTWTGDFFDSDLISDASHLIDNFSEIPAGVNLNTYHSRLVIVGEYGTTETLTGLPPGITDNRSVARVSAPGEPESISKVDGLIIAPLDGNPLTNVQEFRDVLYLFKKTRTFSYSDNYDVPSSWQEEVLDQGIGAPVHGIATVLDTGGVNIDFLLIVDWSGLMLFNGTYSQPEMSWKIESFWRGLDRNSFNAVQIVNDSINKKVWITLPDPNRNYLLHANYANGMNAKEIRWARWKFDAIIYTIALIETDRLIIGAVRQGT